MAEAYVSMGADQGGITAIHYNPGAAAFLKGLDLSLMGRTGLVGESFNSFFIGAPSDYGSFSGSVLYYSAGDLELINTLGESRTVKAQSDIAASFNYADLLGGIYGTGVTAKVLRSTLVEDYSATAVAVDLGSQARWMKDRLSAGIAVRNLGTKLNYINSEEPLPLTFQGGASYRFDLGKGTLLTWSVDLLKENQGNQKAFIGVECSSLFNILTLRGGYKTGQDLGKIAAGMGLGFGRFLLDFGVSDSGTAGRTYAVSMGYAFEGRERSVKSPAKAPEQSWLQNGRKVILAVLPIRTQGVDAGEAYGIARILRAAIAEKQGPFQVMDRISVEKVLKSRGRETSGCETVDCAMQMGQALGADKAVMSSLETSGTGYVLNVKIVNALLGEVEYQDSVKSSSLKEMKEDLDRLAWRLAGSIR